jgi:hypothetical protein
VYVAGLENSTLSLDLYLSFAASETYATLKSLVGTSTTVSYEMALGTLGQISVVFTGGVYSVLEV